MYEQGLGYSGINTARSAVSAVLQTCDGRAIGEHPLVCRFVKGVFQLRTPVPRNKETWDVNTVLDLFRNMKDNNDLSLKWLTLKLCSLILIVSAQRVQTVHFIRLRGIKFHTEGCTIQILEKVKQTRPGVPQPKLELPLYTEEDKLCVVKCLEQYIERTKPIRNGADKLLLCHQNPHKPASKDSVARWMKTVLKQAGLKEFNPHSFRSASSSAMFKHGVALQEIMNCAGWANARTFFRFYNKPVSSAKAKSERNVQHSILKFFEKDCIKKRESDLKVA